MLFRVGYALGVFFDYAPDLERFFGHRGWLYAPDLERGFGS